MEIMLHKIIMGGTGNTGLLKIEVYQSLKMSGSRWSFSGIAAGKMMVGSGGL